MRAICYDKSIVTDLDLPSSQLQAIEPKHRTQAVQTIKIIFLWQSFVLDLHNLKSSTFIITPPDIIGYYTLRDTTEPKFYDNTDFNHVRDGRPLICRNFSHINI